MMLKDGYIKCSSRDSRERTLIKTKRGLIEIGQCEIVAHKIVIVYL